MAEKERQDQVTESTGKRKPARKFILISVFLILMIAGGAVAAKMGVLPIPGLASSKGGSGKDREIKARGVEDSAGFIYPMKPFIVNLVDESGGRYLKVKFEMELSSKDVVPELERRMAQLTDSVIMLLSSKTYKDIANYEGKERMRHEIMIRLNSFLKSGSIRRIYFTEFVMQ